jgi:hypothetical protein
VAERSWVSSDGRTWTFRPRSDVRKNETDTHVVLLAESLGETRIVACVRAEWESTAPDLGELLARSVPQGGSRGVGPWPASKPKPSNEPY